VEKNLHSRYEKTVSSLRNSGGAMKALAWTRSGQINILCGAGIFGKISCTCGQQEIQYT